MAKNNDIIEENTDSIDTEEENESVFEAPEEYEDDFFSGETEQINENADDISEEDQEAAEEINDGDSGDNNKTESEEKAKRKFPWKKTAIAAGCIVCAAALAYLGGVIYYSRHFFPNTQVGNFDCSNMTAERAKQIIENDLANYSFVIREKNNVDEVVTAEDIDLQHTDVKNFNKLIEDQNAYMWMFNRGEKQLPLDIEISLNEDMLYNKISELEVAKQSKIEMDGSTAGLYYENGEFHVKDDGTKNIVSVNMMFEVMKNKILNLYKGMTLEDEGCYVGLEGDDTMASVLKAINKFVSTKVTYKNGEESTLLNGDTINEWVKVGEDYSYDIDKSKVREYIANLASAYNTIGTTRTFKTSAGAEVSIAGGDYGWLVDNEQETEALNNLIWEGAQEEREPIYKKTAQTHGNADVANTYVEVSIPAQHMWFYKDGELIVTSDIVTGNPLRGNATHTGVYILKYKERNATLRGEGYETPVKYWMPFNGGEGLHDASWRGVFGGAIYRGGGSHGCVNLPSSVAAKLFENVTPGTPVVVY